MLFIETYNEVPGFHCWPDAPAAISYLRSRHRHVFHIRCLIPVGHGDRELEIIETQKKIEGYLRGKYGREGLTEEAEFGELSCEMIAEELSRKFSAAEVQVLEDGYGGARYVLPRE